MTIIHIQFECEHAFIGPFNDRASAITYARQVARFSFSRYKLIDELATCSSIHTPFPSKVDVAINIETLQPPCKLES